MTNLKKNMPKKENNNETQPCNKFKRNECGLIEGVNYVYNDDNTVNWRAMVRPEYLVINRQQKDKVEELTSKKFNDINPLDLEDKYLLILLAGIKELAKTRGYNKVNYHIATAGLDYAGVVCEIEWIPNFESGMQPIVFSSLGDASKNNTFDWAGNYLLAVAENRSFVRCVRNYLGIHIVGSDEISDKTGAAQELQTVSDPTKPHGVLQKKLEERGTSFEKLKAQWVKLGNEANWDSITDIPLKDVWTILEMMKKKEK